MVNENKGKEYQINQYYDRKLLRSVIRNQIIRQDGYHKVNKKLHYIWKQLQNGEVKLN